MVINDNNAICKSLEHIVVLLQIWKLHSFKKSTYLPFHKNNKLITYLMKWNSEMK